MSKNYFSDNSEKGSSFKWLKTKATQVNINSIYRFLSIPDIASGL